MAKFVPLAKMAAGAARNKRIAILAANPGTRAKIPDALLPAQYKAGRATAQRIKAENATLYNPAQILSGNDLRKAVTAEVNLSLNPKLAAYDRLTSNLQSQENVATKRLGDYFSLYNTQTANAAANLGTSGQQLAQQLAANAGQAQKGLDNLSQGIQQRNAADVALRGPGLQDVNPALGAVDFAKAQSVSAQQDYSNQAGAQAQGNLGLAGTIAAVAPVRAGEAMAGLTNKFNQQIFESQSKRADLEATRGDLTTQTLNKMRDDQFTNLATMKGLNIRQSDLNETIRSNKAQEKLTSDTINQRNKDSIRDAKTASEKLAFDRQYKAAQLDIKRGIDPVTGKPLPKKPGSAADALNAFKLDFLKKHGYLPQTGPGKTKLPTGAVGTSHGGVLDPTTGKRVLTQNEINTTATGKFAPVFNAVQQTAQKSKYQGNRQTGGISAGQDILKLNPTLDPLFVSVALDAAYDGYVSRANEAKLRNRGFVPKDFGLKSFQQYQQEVKKTKRGPAGKLPGFGNTP